MRYNYSSESNIVEPEPPRGDALSSVNSLKDHRTRHVIEISDRRYIGAAEAHTPACESGVLVEGQRQARGHLNAAYLVVPH